MKRDDLRKVIYQQVKSMGFDPRPEQREENEKLEEKRDVFFHKWIEEATWEEKYFYAKTFGLIEDCETGECIKITQENIQFKDCK